MNAILFRFSRWWNRLAYLIIRIGRAMIWDFTGKNADILRDGDFGRQNTEAILCDRPITWVDISVGVAENLKEIDRRQRICTPATAKSSGE